LKARLLAVLASGAVILGVLTAPAAQAAPPTQVAGAAGLVAAIVQLNNTLNNNDVMVLDSNFNNLTALNNVLNHSPILNNSNISVNVLSLQDFLNNNNINITLKNVLTNFLNNNSTVIPIGISVLSGGIVIYT
jgi:hypothetical protein